MWIITKITLATACIYCLISCLSGYPSECILFDFESDDDLNRVHWKCHTLFVLSDVNVTHGKKSLRLELYPSNYPGLSFKLDKKKWSRYKTLSFDVYNPAKDTSITVRIDDTLNYTSYDDRYNKKFIIKHGLNRISIPLNTLITSGTNRVLDLHNIYRLLIFMAHPQSKSILYIDYVHLAKDTAIRYFSYS